MDFQGLLSSLNEQGFLLKKGPKLYQLQTMWLLDTTAQHRLYLVFVQLFVKTQKTQENLCGDNILRQRVEGMLTSEENKGVDPAKNPLKCFFLNVYCSIWQEYKSPPAVVAIVHIRAKVHEYANCLQALFNLTSYFQKGIFSLCR